jgi:hypothetical protein
MPLNYVTATNYEDKVTALRVDPKIRYLADVARAVTGETFTRFLERSLEASCKSVSLRIPEKPEIVQNAAGQWVIEEPDAEEERFANEHMSVTNQGELLWCESQYMRLLILSKLAPHLVAPDDTGLLNYIEDRADLRIKMEHGFKLDRDRINNEWEAINTAYAESKKKVA